MADKKFTPIEAAIAVLNKAREMYKGSPLAKSDTLNKPLFSNVAGAATTPGLKTGMGQSHMGSKVRSGNIEGAKETATKTLQNMKGHIKLAKFVGRMEAKKGVAKSETGHEKGVATKMNPNAAEGKSIAGAHVRFGDTGEAKKQAVGRMMDAENIKPKLPE